MNGVNYSYVASIQVERGMTKNYIKHLISNLIGGKISRINSLDSICHKNTVSLVYSLVVFEILTAREPLQKNKIIKLIKAQIVMQNMNFTLSQWEHSKSLFT